jgi:hypothetical protein
VLPAAWAGGADASANPKATINPSVAVNAGPIYLLMVYSCSAVSALPAVGRQKPVSHQPILTHQVGRKTSGVALRCRCSLGCSVAVVLASSVYVALVEPDSAATVAAARNIVLILTS